MIIPTTGLTWGGWLGRNTKHPSHQAYCVAKVVSVDLAALQSTVVPDGYCSSHWDHATGQTPVLCTHQFLCLLKMGTIIHCFEEMLI